MPNHSPFLPSSLACTCSQLLTHSLSFVQSYAPTSHATPTPMLTASNVQTPGHSAMSPTGVRFQLYLSGPWSIIPVMSMPMEALYPILLLQLSVILQFPENGLTAILVIYSVKI